MDSQATISARIELSPRANQILNVIKAKYNLNDKSEAINKFLEVEGHDLIEEEASEDYIKKMMAIINKHMAKPSRQKMTAEELDNLFEV